MSPTSLHLFCYSAPFIGGDDNIDNIFEENIISVKKDSLERTSSKTLFWSFMFPPVGIVYAVVLLRRVDSYIDSITIEDKLRFKKVAYIALGNAVLSIVLIVGMIYVLMYLINLLNTVYTG